MVSFLYHDHVFSCESLLVCCLKYPCIYFLPIFCFLFIFARLILALYILFLFIIVRVHLLFFCFRVFESIHWRYLQRWCVPFLLLLLTYDALCIVISFLVLWFICWSSSLDPLKNYSRIIQEVDLMRLSLQYKLVSTSFFTFTPFLSHCTSFSMLFIHSASLLSYYSYILFCFSCLRLESCLRTFIPYLLVEFCCFSMPCFVFIVRSYLCIFKSSFFCQYLLIYLFWLNRLF